MQLSLTLGKRLLLFACVSLLCFIIAAVGVGVLTALGGASAKWLRIATVVQDLLMFITPAVITAVLVTRLPARLLCIDSAPDMRLLLMAVVTMLVAIPAMNTVIAWNEGIELPASMHGVEEWMRQSEDQARAFMDVILGGDTVMALIVNILIVGVLAGVSEEIFFRGGLQRLLTTGGVSAGLAVWLTAVIFSGVHMQFYGFVPRMLLGVYFGYALVWSRSLWLPIILHALNNSIYVCGLWLHGNADETPALATFTATDWLMAAVSAVATAACLCIMYRMSHREAPAPGACR